MHACLLHSGVWHAQGRGLAQLCGTMQAIWSTVFVPAAHLVVACESVDAALHEDEPELAVLVLAVELQVLAHGHRLLDEVVQVLGDLGRQTQTLHDAQDLGPCDGAHLDSPHYKLRRPYMTHKLAMAALMLRISRAVLP